MSDTRFPLATCLSRMTVSKCGTCQRRELFRRSVIKSGKWPASEQEIISRHLKSFLLFLNSINFVPPFLTSTLWYMSFVRYSSLNLMMGHSEKGRNMVVFFNNLKIQLCYDGRLCS
jgi:hypothetical protein